MINTIRRYGLEISTILLVSGLVLIKLSFWEFQVASHHFMMRDFLRAQNLLRGEFIWYGPELNYGGFLPGPFYYYLLAIPQIFSAKIEGLITFVYLLSGISAGLIFYGLSRLCGLVSGIIAFVLLITSSIYQEQVYLVWNPSFLPIFNVAIALLMFAGAFQRKWTYFYYGAFLTSLAVQIHLSALFHWLTFLVLIIYFQASVKNVFRNTMIMALIFISPLLPYFISRFFQANSRIDQLVASAQGQFFNNLIFDPLLFLTKAEIPYALFALIAITMIIFKKRIRYSDQSKAAFTVFGAHLILNFPVSVIQDRYLLVYVVYSIIAFSLAAGETLQYFFSLSRRMKQRGWAFVLIFSLTSILAFAKDEYTNYRSARVETKNQLVQVRKGYWTHLLGDYLKIVRKIKEDTGWRPEVFRNRVYHLVANSFEIGTLYKNYDQNSPAVKTKPKYDGVIIYPLDRSFLGDDWLWLKNIGLPESILVFFKDKVDYIEVKDFHNLRVTFYKLKDGVSEYQIPHNMGHTYWLSESEKFLTSISEDNLDEKDVYSFENEKVFVWDFGTYYQWPRRIAIFANYTQEEGQLNLSLRLESPLLSLTFPNQDNFFDQIFIGGLSVSLMGKDWDKKAVFYPYLGDPFVPIDEINRKYKDYMFTHNWHGKGHVPLMTPLTQTMNLSCQDKITKMRINIEDLVILRFRSQVIESHRKELSKSFDFNQDCSND